LQTESKQSLVGVCPLEGIIDIIGKKWALQIVCIIGNNQRIRYGEIQQGLSKISSKTLAKRLRELENAKLIIREAYPEIPPRVEYSLSKDGAGLRKAMIPLMEWASQR
jgi:DNA-binding HxlR family transcriptional regulator